MTEATTPTVGRPFRQKRGDEAVSDVGCPHGGRRPAPPRAGEIVGTYVHCTDLECGCGEARGDALFAELVKAGAVVLR